MLVHSMKNALPLESVSVLVFVFFVLCVCVCVCSAFESHFSEQERCNKTVNIDGGFIHEGSRDVRTDQEAGKNMKAGSWMKRFQMTPFSGGMSRPRMVHAAAKSERRASSEKEKDGRSQSKRERGGRRQQKPARRRM